MIYYLSKLFFKLKLILGFYKLNKNITLNSYTKEFFNKRDLKLVKIEKKKNLKVLFFTHNLNNEGAQISLYELISGFKEFHDFDIELISFQEGPLMKKYAEQNINVYILKDLNKKFFSISSLNKQTNELAKRIKYYSPDIVYVNSLVNFFVLIASRKASVPSILNCREGRDYKSVFNYLSKKLSLKAISSIAFPERIIFVSKDSLDKWKLFNLENKFLIVKNQINNSRFSNCIAKTKKDYRKFLKYDQDEHIFLSVGTLSRNKNQLLLIKSFFKISKILKNPIRVIILGQSNNLYGLVLKLISFRFKYHKFIKIIFIDSKDNVGIYYRAADSLLFTSRSESCPRVILEAKFFDLNIISTDINSVKEITNEYKKIVFFKKDSYKDLSNKIITSLNKKVKSNELKFFKNDPYKDMVNQYYKIIVSIFKNS